MKLGGFSRTLIGLVVSIMLVGIFTPPALAANETILGAYYGSQGWDMRQVAAMEQWQGKKQSVVNLYTNWDSDSAVMSNLFSQQLPNIWANKNIPMVTWELFTNYSGTTPSNITALVAKGQYDAYIQTWSDRLKDFLKGPDGVYSNTDDRRIYLRLGHEMNGSWYPWAAASGGSTPADYISMWKRVRSIFTGKGLDGSHVQWVWSVNAGDVGGYKAEQFYPGDGQVSWVAIDGYNWGGTSAANWQTPDQVFGNMITRLRALTWKPLAITEFASSSLTSTGTNIAAKSNWITSFFSYAQSKNIKMVVWFNTDKEQDWASFGGGNGTGSYTYNGQTYKVYNSYKTSVSSSSYIGSSSSNVRLLTNNQFNG